ncbi:acetyltransferase [Vibrio sp. TRT 21S02]|uniref:acetyltransferase n=1 Tax=Vibrio sp. TRT 21S02 TaxID=3418507 RepID=UPI003CEFBF34
MSKKIVIFGISEIADMAYFYFNNDTEYQVVAFTIDNDFIKSSNKFELPVIAFENVEDKYPPEEYDMFVALSYTKLNQLRKIKYGEAKAKGYYLASYISSNCVNYAKTIGDNCFILEDNTIQPYVSIGDNVTLWSGNHIGHHSVIDSHNFISSHVVVSGGVHVKESCFIGVNATIRDHVIIGKESVLGAGALILQDVEEKGVYMSSSTERSRVPSSKLRNI